MSLSVSVLGPVRVIRQSARSHRRCGLELLNEYTSSMKSRPTDTAPPCSLPTSTLADSWSLRYSVTLYCISVSNPVSLYVYRVSLSIAITYKPPGIASVYDTVSLCMREAVLGTRGIRLCVH